MSIKVDVSLLSNQYTKGQKIVDVSGDTVGQCLADLIEQYPSIKEGLFADEGKLHNFIDIYVNDESTYPEALAKPVKDGDKLHIIFLIGGG